MQLTTENRKLVATLRTANNAAGTYHQFSKAELLVLIEFATAAARELSDNEGARLASGLQTGVQLAGSEPLILQEHAAKLLDLVERASTQTQFVSPAVHTPVNEPKPFPAEPAEEVDEAA